MTISLRITGALLALGLSITACGNGDSANPEPPPPPRGNPPVNQPGSTAGGQVAAQPVPQAVNPQLANPQSVNPQPATPQPVAAPAQRGYPRDGIRTIPDSCASPVVMLATAPASVGNNHAWQISRQAFLANQQFRITDGPPAVPGQVQLATYKYNNSAYALVGKCKDGGTCNDIAAMYKAIVRSSHPQVVCGKLNGISSSPVGRGFGWGSDGRANLPAASDTIGKCARLNACMIATDRSTPGDPFLECQKAPSNFKLDCATRYPCSEVLACTGR